MSQAPQVAVMAGAGRCKCLFLIDSTRLARRTLETSGLQALQAGAAWPPVAFCATIESGS